MRNLLALFGLVVIGFGGAGWYLGWYKLSYTRTPDGQLQINANVDTKKVVDESSDFLHTAGAAVSDNVQRAAQEAKASAPPTAPGTTQGPVTPPGQPAVLPLPEVPAVPGPTPTVVPVGGHQGPIRLHPPKP